MSDLPMWPMHGGENVWGWSANQSHWAFIHLANPSGVFWNYLVKEINFMVSVLVIIHILERPKNKKMLRYWDFMGIFRHVWPSLGKFPIKSRCCFDSVTAESFQWRHHFLGLIHSFIHFYSFASWKKQFLHSFEKPPQILLKLWLTTMTRAVLAQIAVRS